MNQSDTMSAQAFRSEVRAGDADAVERLVRATGVFSKDETAIARELVEASLTHGAHASGYHFLFADGGVGLRGRHLDRIANSPAAACRAANEHGTLLGAVPLQRKPDDLLPR